MHSGTGPCMQSALQAWLCSMQQLASAHPDVHHQRQSSAHQLHKNQHAFHGGGPNKCIAVQDVRRSTSGQHPALECTLMLLLAEATRTHMHPFPPSGSTSCLLLLLFRFVLAACVTPLSFLAWLTSVSTCCSTAQTSTQWRTSTAGGWGASTAGPAVCGP